MSSLVWLNDGSLTANKPPIVLGGKPRGTDTDNFSAAFGKNATLARAIVHQAMSDWEQVIANFNYTHVGKVGYAPLDNTFSFSLVADALPRGLLGDNDPFETKSDLSGNDAIGLQPGSHQGHPIDQFGKPFKAVITMDDNGGGHGWYFDPHPADSAEFPRFIDQFAAQGNLGGREDFYTAVSRQIGKAVGISIEATNLAFFYGSRTRGLDPMLEGTTHWELRAAYFFDRTTNKYIDSIFTQADGTGLYDGPRTPDFQFGDHVIDKDLMSVNQPVNTRFLISDIDVGFLAAGYIADPFTLAPSMSLRYPTELGKSFLTFFDPSSQSLTIRSDSRVPDNTIALSVSGAKLLVNLNGFTNAYALSSLKSVTINTGPGNDVVTLPGSLVALNVKVNGGGETSLILSDATTRVSYSISAGQVTLANPALATSGAHSRGARAPHYIVTFSGVNGLSVRGDGGDVATVGSTSAATPVVVSGVRAVTVGSGGKVGGIAGAVDVVGSISVKTDLKIDDSSDLGTRAVVIDSHGVTSLAPAPIRYAGVLLHSLTILGGAASNQYRIDDTPRNVRGDLAVSLTTGPRNDHVTINAASSGLTLDVGAGTNTVDVVPSAVSRQLYVQSLGGSYALNLNDQADAQTRYVNLSVLRIPASNRGSAVALKAHLLGVIDGFSPGEIDYEPTSLTNLTVRSGQLGPGVAFPFGNTFAVKDTFTPARPGASTSILLGSANTVSVETTHGPLNVSGVGGGNTFQVKLSTRTKRLDALPGLVTVTNTGVDMLDQNAPAKETVTVGARGLSVNGTERVRAVGPAAIRFNGSGRGNAYDVQATPGGVVFLVGGSGADTFHVSGPGRSLDGFNTLSLLGGGGADSLTIDDSGALAPQTYDLGSTTFFGSPVTSLLRAGGTTVNGFGLPSISFFAGNRGSTIGVEGSNPHTALAIHGGAGDDTIALKSVAPDAPISVDGGGGTNTLDDSGYTPPGSTIPPPTPVWAPAGLVAFYKAEGNFADALGLHGGTAQGDVTYGPGEVGQALVFHGTNGAVEVLDTPELDSANVTVEAWVKSSGVTAYSYVLSKGAQGLTAASYGLYTGGASGLTFYIFDGANSALSPDAGPALWDGKWHHVAATYDGSTIRLFVDGKEVGSGTHSTLQINYQLPTSHDLFIGSYNGPSPNSFNGSVDELSVYNRALSSSEIQGIYTAGSAGKTVSSASLPQPVSLFKGEGNADDALGRNNGHIDGGVSFAPGKVGQAFHFNGLDSFVEVFNTPSLNPASGLTLDAWINPEKYNDAFPGSSAIIFGRASGYQMRLMSDTGRIRFFAAGTNGTNIDSISVVPLNVWTHITGTYDLASNALRLYINGVLDTSFFVSGPIADTVVAPLQIGGLVNPFISQSDLFTGRIDEAAIYDRALTPAEVKALDSGGTNPVPTPAQQGVVVDLPLGKATGLGLGVTHLQNVIGSAFDDILVGNGGGALSGGPGRDLLIAGATAAALDGGTGDDILIGGTTSLDRDLAALDAALAVWSDIQTDYATRVARLRAGPLAIGKAASNGQTNMLRGGDGLDLFFAPSATSTDSQQDETLVII